MSAARLTATVERGTLRDRAIGALREAILDGELAPGEWLREIELSESLRISRGTIREALLRLADEDLVVVEARRGVRVRRLDPAEVHQVYEVRMALEGVAARRAATRPAGEVEPPLRAAWERFRETGRDDSLRARMERDLAFHEAICATAQNPWLLETWRRLSGPIRVAILSAGAEAVTASLDLDRHRHVLEAILAGDGERAERLIVTHLRASADLLHRSMAPAEAIATEGDPRPGAR